VGRVYNGRERGMGSGTPAARTARTRRGIKTKKNMILSTEEHRKIGAELQKSARRVEIVVPTIGAIVLAVIIYFAIC
jgi:hypothetical protein